MLNGYKDIYLICQICRGCSSQTVASCFSRFDQICISVDDFVIMDLFMILFMLWELNGSL